MSSNDVFAPDEAAQLRIAIRLCHRASQSAREEGNYQEAEQWEQRQRENEADLRRVEGTEWK